MDNSNEPRQAETTSVKAVKETLSANGIRLVKSMGQNFLIDPNIPEKIVKLSGIDSTCGVLEVGPGLGALTACLSHVAGHVTAVELDGKLLPILRDKFSGQDNVDLVHGDILKLDITGLVGGRMAGLQRHVCSNLPYNITSPVLMALINTGLFQTITVMVQREVALRLCAGPGSPEYGAFSVYINYHCKPEILFDVAPECFLPRPAIWSSVVRMEVNDEKPLGPKEEALFFRVVRAAFGQRRKTLVNALHAAFGGDLIKEEIARCVSSCGFDAMVRGETLGIGEFLTLSAELGRRLVT